MSPKEKQIVYRDARFTNKYDDIWQSVNKCVFCDLKDKYIFFEENGIVLTISLYAYIDGHFMIVPRRHVKSTKELTQSEWETLRKFTYVAKKIIRSVYGIKGMQLVQKDGSAAQSTVEHLHFHCVPFDSPDLCTWNYRKLECTPLENVAKYKNAKQKIIQYSQNFESKYQTNGVVSIVCDVIITNERSEILLQERTKAASIDGDFFSLPGGYVENHSKTLEEELSREVLEEIGLEVDPKHFILSTSQIEDITYTKNSEHLALTYKKTNHVIRNTYSYELGNFVPQLKSGDDCKQIHWISLENIFNHPRVSLEVQDSVKSYLDKKTRHKNAK